MQQPIETAERAQDVARPRTLSRAPTNAACFGRDVELARLCSTYDLVTRQGGRLVLLEGPSGVGKAQLLQAFRTKIRLDGGVVLEGRCEPGQAFGPFAEVVERALRFLEEVGQTPGESVSHLACREGCHPFWYQHRGWLDQGAANRTDDHLVLEQRLSFFDAIGALLRDVAKLRVPVVLLHALERADRGTLELLRYLLEGAGPWNDGLEGPLVRALFVASVRTDITHEHSLAIEPIRQHAGTIPLALGQLDPEGVRAYLQSPETVARIIERTGGHPEAIDLLLHGDPLTPEARVARLLASLAGQSLAGQARGLAEALAVIEHPADAELLSRIAGTGSLDPAALQAFGASELIERSVSDGHILFAFARERDREHAYSLLSEARRVELHRRAMEEFAGRAGADQYAAHHGLLAGELHRAIPFARAAASALAARHAHAEAAALLERIVDRAGVDVSTELREYLADLYRLAGDYKQALVHARSLREDNPESAAATRRLGELLRLAGHLDEAAARLTDARRLAAASDDPRAVAEVDAQLAELHYRRSSYDEAEQHATLAIEAAQQYADVVVELDGRNTLAKIALARHEASAATLFEENRALAVEVGLRHQEAQALTNLGVALLRAQELDAAERAFEEAISVARAATDTRDYAIATENLAVLAHLKRDYARAQVLYHEAVALLKRLGNRAMLARAATNLGELYLSLGERSRAHTLCEFASHMGGTGLSPIVAAEILVLRGRIESGRGSIGTARAAFQAARETYARLGDSQEATAILDLARTALAEGDVPGARQLLLELPLQESPKRACEIALVASEIDRLRGESGTTSARRALDLAEQAEDTELALRSLLALARAHLEHGDADAVAGLLARAETIETELTSKVPEESMASWVVRPDRAELADLAARLATRTPDAGRRSSVPPGPRMSRPVPQDRHRWSKLYPDLVGDSAPMNQVRTLLDKVAPTDALVLIRGESGTGKELIAEALHHNSPRRNRPIVKVNCAALVETLLLSELFGHERGAFTGANARKKGRFELADGGTIFLDEIGDISAKTQVALLRVLQERQFERVGGTQPIRVDVRIIAATHRDLEAMVREGSFREDLYYRLRGVMVELPPLRSRLDDLPAVAQHLLERIAAERGEEPRGLSDEASDLLVRHRWPGNVRELENVLRSATLFAESSVLEAQDFAAFREVFTEAPEPETSSASTDPADLEELMYHRVRRGESSLFEMKKSLERECIVRALRETDGNITQAASLLGMKRPRLSQLVKQYGLQGAGEAE
jgi:DNA-binding NtrC family response regulator/tetratricopeptide (TPR) repeat protein